MIVYVTLRMRERECARLSLSVSLSMLVLVCVCVCVYVCWGWWSVKPNLMLHKWLPRGQEQFGYCVSFIYSSSILTLLFCSHILLLTLPNPAGSPPSRALVYPTLFLYLKSSSIQQCTLLFKSLFRPYSRPSQ